jgi:hypothetical protein
MADREQHHVALEFQVQQRELTFEPLPGLQFPAANGPSDVRSMSVMATSSCSSVVDTGLPKLG